MFGFGRNNKVPCDALKNSVSQGFFISTLNCSCLWCNAVRCMNEGSDVDCRAFQIIAMEAKNIRAENEKLTKENEQLKRDLAFVKPLRSHFDVEVQRQLEEDNKKLKAENEDLKSRLSIARKYIGDMPSFTRHFTRQTGNLNHTIDNLEASNDSLSKEILTLKATVKYWQAETYKKAQLQSQCEPKCNTCKDAKRVIDREMSNRYPSLPVLTLNGEVTPHHWIYKNCPDCSSERKHKCPTCKGLKKIEYTTLRPFEIPSTDYFAAIVDCHACSGTGIMRQSGQC